MNIPENAVFYKEEAGVQWFRDSVLDIDCHHYMLFDGRVLSGNWVGPKAVFKTLVFMGEERQAYPDENKLVGAITRWVKSGKLVKVMRGEQ